ncbi:hypothetical protein M011DRAFT_472743 [Sporormia fimetaria CBS 119925]|uniref:Uncharacterized protein n=1 Tax=Sporormia fimetaria CBS 119925 TaxID=1340428 RepID=A0A6A6UXN8_9PLEO|nr:hypothetical protein M011DRAFT_472743 [Sporormia fimetaria CBS 119925]
MAVHTVMILTLGCLSYLEAPVFSVLGQRRFKFELHMILATVSFIGGCIILAAGKVGLSSAWTATGFHDLQALFLQCAALPSLILPLLHLIVATLRWREERSHTLNMKRLMALVQGPVLQSADNVSALPETGRLMGTTHDHNSSLIARHCALGWFCCGGTSGCHKSRFCLYGRIHRIVYVLLPVALWVLIITAQLAVSFVCRRLRLFHLILMTPAAHLLALMGYRWCCRLPQSSPFLIRVGRIGRTLRFEMVCYFAIGSFALAVFQWSDMVVGILLDNFWGLPPLDRRGIPYWLQVTFMVWNAFFVF